MSVPFNLNPSASSTEILKEVGLAVKGAMPSSAQCPLCKRGKLGVYEDPILKASEGGSARWYHCIYCNWSGDSLEFFAKVNCISNLSEAIKTASYRGCLAIPLSQLTDSQIESYNDHYISRRTRIRDSWNLLRKHVSDGDRSEVNVRLHQFHLATGQSHISKVVIDRYVGGGLWSDVKVAFGRDVLPRKGFRSVLAFAYQDVPGRISYLKYLGDSEEPFVQTFPDPDTNIADGGILMLDCLSPYEDIVYAFDNELFALLLQRVYYTSFGSLGKIIAFNKDTFNSWSSVSAEKVVIKCEKLTWRTFKHASKVRNAYIAVKPDMDYRGLALKVNSTPVMDILNQVEKSAKPWKSVFIDWILAKGRNEAEIAEAFSHMKLCATDKINLLELCPTDLVDELRHRLGKITSLKTVIMNNRKTIIEKDDGWYVVINDSEEMICSSPFTLDKIINDPQAKTTWLTGVINYKDRRIGYKDPYDFVSEHTEEWLKKCLLNANIAPAYIQRGWRKDLFGVARKFMEPIVVSTDKHYGLDASSGTIMFPRFTIQDGRFVSDNSYVESVTIPGNNILPPKGRTFLEKHCLVKEDDPVLNSHIAGVAAITANILNASHGWSRRPIGIIGSAENQSFKTGVRFAELFDMQQSECFRPSDKYKEELLSKISAYNWFHYLRVTDCRLCGIKAAGFDRLVTTIDRLESLALKASGEKWTLIAGVDSHDVPPLPDRADWLTWLAGLQLKQFNVEVTDELPVALVRDFCTWWSTQTGHNKDNLMAATLKHLNIDVDAGKALVMLYAYAYKMGLINVERKPFYKGLKDDVFRGKNAIYIDEEEGVVLLVRSKLFDALRHNDLPAIDTTPAERDLRKNGVLIETTYHVDGWLIPRKYFTGIEGMTIFD